MPAAFVDVENFAGFSGQLREREAARGLILSGSVAHDAVTSFGTDQHEVGAPGLRAPLGATGDVNRPGETKPRQQRRQPASIAARVQRGRPTAGSPRASFDLQQWVAGIDNQAIASGGIENALP